MLRFSTKSVHRGLWLLLILAMAVVLLGAVSARAGEWAIFKEVEQEELDRVSDLLDRHCEVTAMMEAEQIAWLAFGRDGDWFRNELKPRIYAVCREAAAYSAIQYGAAVNRAREGHIYLGQ